MRCGTVDDRAQVTDPLAIRMIHERARKLSEGGRVGLSPCHAGAGQLDGAIAITTGKFVNLAQELRCRYQPQAAEFLGRGAVAACESSVGGDQPRGASRDGLGNVLEVFEVSVGGSRVSVPERVIRRAPAC